MLLTSAYRTHQTDVVDSAAALSNKSACVQKACKILLLLFGAGLHFTYSKDRKAASQAATPPGSHHRQHSSSDSHSDEQDALRSSDAGNRGPVRDSASSNRPLKEAHCSDDGNLESEQEVVRISCVHVHSDCIVLHFAATSCTFS